MTRITRSYIAPNPKEFEYWVDLTSDPKGNVIKYYAGGSKWKPLNDGTNNDQSDRITALEEGKVDKIEGKDVVAVNNTLTSTSTVDALAAAQGKALKDLIDALTLRVTALETAA